MVNQNFRKKQKSKDNILYNGLVNNEFSGESEVANKLFKTDPGNRNFRNTKARLKQKLLNNLFFLDYHKSSYTAYQRAYYECLNEIHQIKILLQEGANCIAIRKIPALIKKSIEYELYEIALDATILNRNELSRLGKCTPVNVSEEDIKRIRLIQGEISKCEDLYFDTLVLMNKSVSSYERIMNEIPRNIQRIKRASKRYQLRRLDVIACKLELNYHTINQDYKGILNVCSYLENKYVRNGLERINVDIQFNELVFLKLFSLYVMDKNEAGIKYAEKVQGIFRQGNTEWFKFKEYQFLILMKAEKYHQATKVFRTVRINKNFSKLTETDQERWQIYRVYLLFVNDSKLIKWGFDIDKFNESTPGFDKSLQGYTIATLIIQFLFYFREADIKNQKMKLQQLSQLSSVHLDKRHNYRNSLFIRMLEIISEREYNFESISEKGATYLHKLKNAPIPPDGKLEIEVIPFERLWEYILNILKTSKYYLHYHFYHFHEA